MGKFRTIVNPVNFEFDQTHSISELLSLIGGQLFLMGAYRPFPQYFFWEYSASVPPVILLGGWFLLKHRFRCFLQPAHWGAFVALCTLSLFWLLLVQGSPALDSMMDQIGFNKLRINVRFTAAIILPLVIVAAKGFDSIRSRHFQRALWLCTVASSCTFLLSTHNLRSIAGHIVTGKQIGRAHLNSSHRL